MRALIALALVGCAPELGGDPAAVPEPRILALQAHPAEARPGDPVTLTALVAIPPGQAPFEAALAWCVVARSVAENRVASQACLVGEAAALRPTDVEATLPAEGCALFGSEPPPARPGEVPRRPADPDATGGYYQPVWVALADGTTGVGRVRLRCALPGAPAPVAMRFAAEAVPNENPVLTAPPPEPAGEPGAWRLAADASAPETHLAYDVATATLTRSTERFEAQWYVSAGGLTATTTGTHFEALWRPGSGPARAWLVVRDGWGGVAWTVWEAPFSL